MSLRLIVRLFLAPLLVALFTAAELRQFGVPTAAAGGYVAFVCAEAAVLFWGRYQLRLARRRLGARRRLVGRRRRAPLPYDRDDGRRLVKR
jgi:hypothetical protein